MLTALKTALALCAMVAIVPLFVLGATGSWRHALHALREYLVAMAFIAVPALVVVAVVVIGELIG